jgi:hypothetical protein
MYSIDLNQVSCPPSLSLSHPPLFSQWNNKKLSLDKIVFSVMKNFNAIFMFSIYSKYNEGKKICLVISMNKMKKSYVSIKIPVRNLHIVMSHDVPCLRSDGWQA